MMEAIAARIEASPDAPDASRLVLDKEHLRGRDSRNLLPGRLGSNMNERYYYVYAFARPDCHVQDIGPGVDADFPVELISRRADRRRGQPRGPGPVRRAAVRRARRPKTSCGWARSPSGTTRSSARPPGLPPCCRCGWGPILGPRTRSWPPWRDAGRRPRRCSPSWSGRQEWGVRVYQAKHHLDDTAHDVPPPPHRDATDSPGRDYLRRKKAELCKRRELETWVERELQTVQSQLSNQADRCCRVRPLSSQLTGRPEKMVFHAAFLLPEAIKDAWLETVRRVDECIRGKGLLLEVTGPWPPYHFCPPQALTD